MISPKQRINILIILLCSYSVHSDTAAQHDTAVHCRPDQASSLLRLKASFVFTNLLPSWRAGSDCCHWEGVTCDMASGRVISLDLSEFDLMSFRLDPALFNLTSLRNLSLAYNDLWEVPLPASGFERLTDMIHLNLSESSFSGQIPIGIGSLKKLVTLDLSGNYGLYFDEPSFQTVMANLSNLRELRLDNVKILSNRSSWSVILADNIPQLEILSLSQCGISGSIHSSFSRLRSLKVIDLSTNWGLTGEVPEFFAELSSLSILDVSGNSFEGKIPRSLFTLPGLKYVDVSENQLSGSLEDIPSPLTSSLSTIDLSDNQLLGPLPKSFFQLTYLNYLSLESNKLTGTVELGSIWRMKSISYLSLSNNLISLIDEKGERVSTSLPNINYLYLASCNLTEIPGALRYLDAICELDLSSNQISGAIPSWIWENWKGHLTSLNLSRNMFTTLEQSPPLVNITNFAYLDLSFNRLQGTMPIPVTTSREVALDYSNNNFSSIVPYFGIYLKNASYINFSNNKLSGHVPSSICKASKVIIMDLSGNNYSGSVPPCLTKSVNLSVLKLRDNQFHGVLPKNSREGCNLQSIDVNGNQIEGKLPRSLSYCKDLQLLDAGNNQIVDSFPFWLGKLLNLRVLVLRSNKLNGAIRGLKSGYQYSDYFTRLQIIDLASNRLSGNIHSEWFEHLQSMMKNVSDEEQILQYYTSISKKLSYDDITAVIYKGNILKFTKILATFKVIDLSNNSFGGPIPKSLGKLVLLHGLNLSHNAFTGQIPSQLSSLTQLESLDLSWNKLSGEIPPELTSLTSLASLNLSYNNLTGRIPQGNQFGSFTNSSFQGNANLCGKPLSKQCDAPGSTSRNASATSETSSFWQDRLGVILLFIFSGLGFTVGFILAIWFQSFFHIERWTHKH